MIEAVILTALPYIQALTGLELQDVIRGGKPTFHLRVSF